MANDKTAHGAGTVTPAQIAAALKALVDVASDPLAPSAARVAAANTILNRARASPKEAPKNEVATWARIEYDEIDARA